MSKFYIYYDRDDSWRPYIADSAKAYGYEPVVIKSHEDIKDNDGIGFIRLPLRNPGKDTARAEYKEIKKRVAYTIQDDNQIAVYEDKSTQFLNWGCLMPKTAIVTGVNSAMDVVGDLGLPIIAKADVGASSVNVRKLDSEDAARAFFSQIFETGFKLDKGRIQKGHILIQEFIPHELTYRVIRVGNTYTIYKRYNGASGLCEYGKDEAVVTMDKTIESLLAYSRGVFEFLETKFCAIDILQSDDDWYFLECSQGFPYPGPNTKTHPSKVWGSNGKTFAHIWDVLFEEINRGAFA